MTAAPLEAHEPATSPVLRAAVVLGCALLALFALGVSAGYVFAHDPAPRLVSVRLEAPAPPAPGDAPTELRGTLASAGADHIEVATASGVTRLPLAPGAPVEELRRLEGAVPEGATVNVGGSRTETGWVITGIVVLAGGR